MISPGEIEEFLHVWFFAHTLPRFDDVDGPVIVPFLMFDVFVVLAWFIVSLSFMLVVPRYPIIFKACMVCVVSVASCFLAAQMFASLFTIAILCSTSALAYVFIWDKKKGFMTFLKKE